MDDYTRFLVAARDLDRRLGPVEPASPAAIPVDEFLSRLGEFRRLLAQFYPDLTAELTEQAQAVEQASDEARTALTGALALGDSDLVCELAQRLGIAPERLMLLGELAVRSYLSAYARSLPADLTTHRQARCPVCGRLPHMGHIDPNNIKYMHCPVCETTWRFARVGCVSCGNTNTDKLGFFTVEGDDERRVEHCSECAGYLKVINQRLGVREIDWLVEDAATQYLDQLAESEGYVRGGRVVAKH